MSSNSHHLSVTPPDQKNYELTYGLAYQLALEKLVSTAQIEELCRRSGSVLLSEKGQHSIRLSYLNTPYQVTIAEGAVNKVGDPVQVELRDKILILHYLLTASGRPLSGELISFKELGEGLAYYPTFVQRTIQPLITCFGNYPEKMLESARSIGGVKSAFGDFAVTVPAFPRVNLNFIQWRGDDEFPPSANILFDRYVLDYLPMEDLIVLCQTIVWKIVKSFQSLAGGRL